MLIAPANIRSLLCVTLLLVVTNVAFADAIWLANGDRISGRIVFLDGDELVADTDYAGRIAIKWSEIATLSTDQPILIWQAGDPRSAPVKLAATVAGKVLLDTGESVALSQVTRMSYPESDSSAWRFEGIADASVEIKREHDDSTEYDFSIDTRAETDTWRHVVKGEYEHASLNNEITSDNWQVDYRLDRFLGEHVFARASGLYKTDSLNVIAHVHQLGIGLGYRFAHNEVERFDLIASYVSATYDLRATQVRINAALIEWDYRRELFGTNAEIFSEGKLALPNVDSLKYLVAGEFGFRYQFNSWVHLALQFEFDEIKLDSAHQTNQRYTLGVGLKW